MTPAPTFVGRRPELDRLVDAVAALRRASGSSHLIVGEPGIGKSALVDQLARHADTAGARVAIGRCWETETAPPLWPWVEILRQVGAEPDTADILARAAGLPTDADASAAAAERFVLLDHLAHRVARVAESRPLVVIVEDLHDGDDLTVALTTLVAQRAPEGSILMAATARPDTGAGVTPPTAELARTAVTHHLAALAPDESLALLRSLAGDDLTDDQAAEAATAAAGNPLFLVTMAGLVADGQSLAPGPVARSPFGDAVRRRLSALDDAERATLAVAAVLGDPFGVEALGAVAEVSTDDATALIDRPLRRGMLRRSADDPAGYEFAHALIRAVVYGDLDTARCASLHDRAVQWYEHRAALDGGDHTEALAHHAAEAAVTGDRQRAVRYLTDAARAAAASLAFADADRLYDRALRFADAGDAVSPAVVDRHRLDHAVVRRRLGAPDARDLARRVAEDARRRDDVDTVARAALLLSSGIGFIGASLTPEPDVVRLIDWALDRLPPDHHRHRARLLAVRVQNEPGNPQWGADDDATTAVREAELAGDPETLARALGARFARIDLADVEARRQTADDFVRLATEIDDPELEISAHGMRFACHGQAGDAAAMDRVIADVASRRVASTPLGRWTILRWRTSRALFTGKLDEAEALAHQTMAVADDAGLGTEALDYFGIHWFTLLRERDQLDEAIGLFEAAADTHLNLPAFRAAYAFALVEVNRLDDARDELDRLVAGGLIDAPHDPSWLLLATLSTHVAAHTGHLEVVKVLVDQLEPYEGQFVSVGFGTLVLGPVEWFAGQGAWALGHLERAETLFRRSLEMARSSGAVPFIGHSWRSLGETYDAGGDPDAAEVAFRRAAEAYAGAGMDGLAERATRRADEARTQAAAGGPHNLWRRHGDLWHVAHGGHEAWLKDTKGMRYLAALLSRPGNEVLALDLVTSTDPTRTDGVMPAAAPVVPDGTSLGPVIDDTARRHYEQRLTELAEVAAEAEQNNDGERAARAIAERDALVDELRRSVGLGGRTRRTGGAAERARVSVTKALRGAIRRIDGDLPELARHLDQAITTGTYCCYDPPHGSPDWTVRLSTGSVPS